MILVLLIAISSQLQEAPSPQLVAGIRQELIETIRFELMRAKRLHGLTEAQSIAIVDRLDRVITRSAERYARVALHGQNRPAVLDFELSDSVAQQLKDYLGADVADQWREDIGIRRQFAIDALLDGTMVMLDYRVALSQKQYDQIRRILMKQWMLAPHYGLGRMVDDLRPYDSKGKVPTLPAGFPEQAVLDVLTQTQRVAWKTHSARVLDAVAARNAPEPVLRMAEPIELMRTLLTQRADILTEHYSLSAVQSRKLKLAAKGAAALVHQRRVKAFNAVNATQRFQPEEWEAHAALLPELVVSHSPWVEMARKALPKERRRDFDIRTQKRARTAQAAFAAYMSANLAISRMQLSAKEQQAFFRQLRDVPTDPRGVWISAQRYRHFIAIPTESWSKSLSDEDATWITQWLDRMSPAIFGKDR